MKRTGFPCLALATIVLSVGTAGGAQPLPESLIACRNETDDARRLACFDRELERWATTPEERFGLPWGQPVSRDQEEEIPASAQERKEELKSISASVTHISRRAGGELVFTLDNGQVWAQTQAAASRVAVGDEVTIRSATLGSYLLSPPRGRSIRVARIR